MTDLATYGCALLIVLAVRAAIQSIMCTASSTAASAHRCPEQLLRKGNVRLATVDDYTKWLIGHIQRGGRWREVSHSFAECRRPIWIATEDIELLPLYGVEAEGAVIVPAGINVSGRGGHTHLYRLSDYTQACYWSAGKVWRSYRIGGAPTPPLFPEIKRTVAKATKGVLSNVPC